MLPGMGGVVWAAAVVTKLVELGYMRTSTDCSALRSASTGLELAQAPMTRISTKKYPHATAFHEAGHAVVAWSLGLPVGVIRVSDDDASGGTEIGPADHLSLTEQIAVWSAGHAAERLFECPAHELADARD